MLILIRHQRRHRPRPHGALLPRHGNVAENASAQARFAGDTASNPVTAKTTY